MLSFENRLSYKALLGLEWKIFCYILWICFHFYIGYRSLIVIVMSRCPYIYEQDSRVTYHAGFSQMLNLAPLVWNEVSAPNASGRLFSSLRRRGFSLAIKIAALNFVGIVHRGTYARWQQARCTLCMEWNHFTVTIPIQNTILKSSSKFVSRGVGKWF